MRLRFRKGKENVKFKYFIFRILLLQEIEKCVKTNHADLIVNLLQNRLMSFCRRSVYGKKLDAVIEIECNNARAKYKIRMWILRHFYMPQLLHPYLYFTIDKNARCERVELEHELKRKA